jgi:hypothetical protein
MEHGFEKKGIWDLGICETNLQLRICDRSAISAKQAEKKRLVATNMASQEYATNHEVKIVQQMTIQIFFFFFFLNKLAIDNNGIKKK